MLGALFSRLDRPGAGPAVTEAQRGLGFMSSMLSQHTGRRRQALHRGNRCVRRLRSSRWIDQTYDNTTKIEGEGVKLDDGAPED